MSQQPGGEQDAASYLIHHVEDGFLWELPGAAGFADEYNLKNLFGDWTVFGGALDLTPTRVTVVLWGVAILLFAALLGATRKRGEVPRGRWQNAVEQFFLFVRDELAIKNIGPEGRRYTPYLATCFFFIFALNLFGLVPYMAAATGNINVTLVLALATFTVTQVAGMRAQGVVQYWKNIVPAGVPLALYPLLIPLEILGLFTKPFALMMRLFANMLAGHIVISFLIGLIFFMQTAAVAPAAVGLALVMYLLKIFVCFLQAYIFTMLSALFIGLASHAH